MLRKLLRPSILPCRMHNDGGKNVGWNHLNWSLLNQEPNRRLHRQTRNLINLRRTHPALRGDGLEFLTTDATTGLAVYKRSAPEPDGNVYVAVNFGKETVEVALPFAPDASWREILSGDTLTPDTTSIPLLPGESRVWSNKY